MAETPRTPAGLPRTHTINDVARILNVHPMTIRSWLSQGKMPHHRFGDLYKFTDEDIAEYMDSTKVPATKSPRQQKWDEQLASQRALQESRRRTNAPTPTSPEPPPPKKTSRSR